MIIKVTTSELENQSKQVEADIKSIEKHWKQIEDIINGTRYYWEGEASDTHFRIYKDVEGDVSRILARMRENPEKLLTMAGIYKETEMNAESQAAKLPTDIF